MLWLSYPPLLLPAMEDLEQHQRLVVSEADDGIAAGSIHTAIMAHRGTIRSCRRAGGAVIRAFPGNIRA